jgi:hypothetical protein
MIDNTKELEKIMGARKIPILISGQTRAIQNVPNYIKITSAAVRTKKSEFIFVKKASKT